jgi:tetratricopeptide (TPR) repeat protein
VASQDVANPPWLTRIETVDGRVVGAGFLVDDDLVVTCAHVVPRPAPSQPADLVVRFVHAAGLAVPATLRAADHHPDDDVDVALVRLADRAPAPARVAPLVEPHSLAGHRLVIKGFPVHKDWGDTAVAFAVAQGGPQARWWELHGDAADAGSWVDEGFSGGPVWSETAEGVVGMTVAVATAPGEREAYALPLDVVLEAEPGLTLRVRPVLEDPLTEDRLRHQLAALDAGTASTDPRVIGARFGLALAVLARGTGLSEAEELLERCLADVDAAGLPPARSYGMLLGLADALVEQRRDREALERLDRARRVAVECFGADDARLGPTEERRALALARLGDHPAARVALGRASRLSQDASGPQLASVLFCRAVMASVVDPDEAQRLARRSYDVSRTSHGAEHPGVVRPAKLVGILLAERNDTGPARRFLTEARDLAERHHTTTHPDVAECTAALGALDLQAGDRAAPAMCLQALRTATTAFGDDHPRLVPFLLTAARAQAVRGDQAEAVRLADRAAAVAEGAVDQPGLPEALMARATHRAMAGQTDAGLADAEQSFRLVSANHHDPPPVVTASALAELARVRLMAGETTDAEQAARQALGLVAGTPFARDPRVGGCHTVVGMALTARDEMTEAEQHLGEALRIAEGWFGPDHPETGQAHLMLVGVLRAQARFAEADRSLRRGLDVLEPALPADHPTLVAARRMAGPATRAKRFLDRWGNRG